MDTCNLIIIFSSPSYTLTQNTMSEFNWQPHQLSNSFYRDYTIPTYTPVTVNVNSIIQGIWDIPGTEVFNLSRSHVDFDVVITQTTTGTLTYSYTQFVGSSTVGVTVTGVTPAQIAMHLGKIAPIQSIIFQTDSNIQLVNLTNAQQQSACMVLPQIPLERWITRDTPEQFPGTSAGPYLSRGDLIAPIKKPCLSTPNGLLANQASGFAANPLAISNGPGGYIMTIGQEVGGSTVQLLTPTVGELGSATVITNTGTIQSTMVLRYRINLGDYKNTLFACDKDLYFNRRMRLVVNFDGWYHWGFNFTGNANQELLSTNPGFQNAVNLTTANQSLVVSNLSFQLALQSNETVAAMVRQQVAVDGLRMLFPFTLCTNFTATGGAAAGVNVAANPVVTSNQLQVPINSSLGQRLLRVYSVAINGDNTGAAFCSNQNLPTFTSNSGNPLYTQIQTRLNARFLQDSPLALSNKDDYRFMKEMLKGSAIISSDSFYMNSFFVDNFTSGNRSCCWDDENTSIGGLELKRADGQSVDYVYSIIVLNAMAGTTYYIFQVVQREMVITKDNVLMI